MVRFILLVAICLVFGFIAAEYLPWWAPMPFAFVAVWLLPAGKATAFTATGLGFAIVWVTLAGVRDAANGQLLSEQIAELFHLPHPAFLLAITGLIGWLTGGIGGWTAALLRSPTRRSAAPDQYRK